MFIPANKKKFIDKSLQLEELDHRIFDLEDSVAEKDIEIAIDNLKSIEILKSDWIRIPIGRSEQAELINEIHELGFSNYVIPKYEGYEGFKNIFIDINSINKQAKFILLLENPKAYLDLERTLNEFSSSVYGVSLGIHDFAFESGMKNDYKLLRNIRIKIMLTAKAHSVKPLDVVSMHLKDKKWLEDEILDGFESGYRGKLLIHPYQLEVLNSVEFYTLKQVKEYEKVLKHFKENVKEKDVVFSFNDRVYEKMHIEEIRKIVEWGISFYGTDW
jgi:citrate lyase beta subunit